MPRALRIEYPGAIYHVMNRGDRREPIFRDDRDHPLFLKTLGEALKGSLLTIYTKCGGCLVESGQPLTPSDGERFHGRNAFAHCAPEPTPSPSKEGSRKTGSRAIGVPLLGGVRGGLPRRFMGRVAAGRVRGSLSCHQFINGVGMRRTGQREVSACHTNPGRPERRLVSFRR